MKSASILQDVLNKDHFYTDTATGRTIWLHHVVDETSGEQFVRNEFSAETLELAVKKYPENKYGFSATKRIFEYLMQHGSQSVSSSGSDCFGFDSSLFEKEPDVIGATRNTPYDLLEIFEKEPPAGSQEDFEKIKTQDRFYVDTVSGEIVWIFHNPDAISGDQFVSLVSHINFLVEAFSGRPLEQPGVDEVEAIFDFILSSGVQCLTDIGDSAYSAEKRQFMSEPYAIGMTKETLWKLLDAFRLSYLMGPENDARPWWMQNYRPEDVLPMLLSMGNCHQDVPQEEVLAALKEIYVQAANHVASNTENRWKALWYVLSRCTETFQEDLRQQQYMDEEETE